MAQTPNSSDPSVDINSLEPSGKTRALSAQVENEIFLQRMLGINLQHYGNLNNNDSQRLSNQIAARIAERVDQTRHKMELAGLASVLNTRISEAVRSVVTPSTRQALADPLENRRLRAVADAVRLSVPQSLLDDFVRYGMPVALDVSGSAPRHFLDAANIEFEKTSPPDDPRHIQIDTRASFWRENSFNDRDALVTELEGKTLNQLGISVLAGANPADLQPSYQLTKKDAEHIADAKIEVINLQRRFNTCMGTLTSGQAFSVDAKSLVAAEVRGTPGIHYIGQMDVGGLTSYLSIQENWNRWVQGCEGQPPNAAAVAAAIFTAMGVTSTDPLAVEEMEVANIQKELQEQHQFDTGLREGSDNVFSAAIAATILRDFKDIRGVLGGVDKKKLEDDLLKLRAQRQVHRVISDLKSFSLSLSGSMDYSDLLTEKTNIAADQAELLKSVSGTSGAASWASDVMSSSYAAVAPNDPIAWTTSKNVTAASQLMASALKTCNADIGKFEKFRNKIIELNRTVTSSGLDSAILSSYFGGLPPVVLDAKLTNDLDVGQVINAIIGELESGKEKLEDAADLPALIKKKQEEIDKSDDGALTGASAQHAVIKEYMQRYHGATDAEADGATNYVRGQAQLDAEFGTAAEDMASEMYGAPDTILSIDYATQWIQNLQNFSLSPDAHSRRVVNNIAFACGIPTMPDPASNDAAWRAGRNLGVSGAAGLSALATMPWVAGGVALVAGMNAVRHMARDVEKKPNWSAASYDNLLTAYFAMKKSLDAGSSYMGLNLQGTGFVQEQMKAISTQLLRHHTRALITEMGKNAQVTDDQKKILQDPTRPESLQMLQQFLAGEPPARIASKIDKVIARAHSRTDWIRRNTILRGSKLIKDIGVWGTKKTYGVGKAVLWTAPVAVAVGTKNLAVKTGSAIWKRKMMIAMGAGVGTLLFPGVGSAIGAAVGGMMGPDDLASSKA